MRRHLPPLNALKSFEAAARHQSFTRAARELCVTQGAISKQIQLLEAFFSAPLFERQGGRVVLTALGQQYFTVVSDVLNTLNSATRIIQNQNAQQETLLIDCMPSFSSNWLIPRLTDFYHQHPEYNVELISYDNKPDFAGTEADLAIRCTLLEQQSTNSKLIAEERLLLVASPEISQKIASLPQIFNFKLLQQTTRPQQWKNFLAQNNLPQSTLLYGPSFQHFFMVLTAVQANLGIGLLPDFLAFDAIKQNKITTLFHLSLSSGYGYFLHSPQLKLQDPKIRDFSNWLSQHIENTHTDLAGEQNPGTSIR